MTVSGRRPVYTIGHSNHPFEVFLDLMRLHSIEVVADVRSTPFSRFNPQFSRGEIEPGLKAHAIRYVYLGRELGARPDDPSCYEGGRAVYARIARTSLFQAGVERVIRGANEFRLALMCAEKDPLECHRTLLVTRALVDRGLRVTHILADGSLEPHEAAMERLLDVTGVPHEDLFRTKEELIEAALERQEQRVGWVDAEGDRSERRSGVT